MKANIVYISRDSDGTFGIIAKMASGVTDAIEGLYEDEAFYFSRMVLSCESNKYLRR